MGNYSSKKSTAKVMKINGETTKLKTPIKSIEITKNHPGHVLLDSTTVKHYGIRAKPLDPSHNLEPGRLYFLVELPKFPDHHNNNINNQHQPPIDRVPRRVRSGGIHLGAKEKLESLMLSRRSVSDLSMMRPAGSVVIPEEEESGGVRVKMRLPRAEVERLMNESKSKEEAAEKIMDLYGGRNVSNDKVSQRVSSRFNSGELVVVDSSCGGGGERRRNQNITRSVRFQQEGAGYHHSTSKMKRVGFMPINESEIQLAIAS